MQTKTAFSGITLILLLTVGCATGPASSWGSKPGDLSPEQRAQREAVREWSLGFQYPNISVEEKSLADGTVEKTVTEYGQSDLDVEILDDIAFLLKHDYNIPVKKATGGSAGNIRIHFLYLHRNTDAGYFDCIARIFIYDNTDVLITEKKISVYIRANEFEKFSRECAAWLAGIIS